MLAKFADYLWYRRTSLSYLLLPLSILFRAVIFLRRLVYRLGLLPQARFPVPVIVVGNLTVGGNGKTPVVIALATEFMDVGYRVGIVSRGYGGHYHYPTFVGEKSTADEVGDEALLIAQRTGCSVVVSRKRAQAVERLISEFNCNVIISDDGLQHYALRRDIEICVVDSGRRFGNRFCLPAGPLREPISRLKSVTFILYKSDGAVTLKNSFVLEPLHFVNIKYPERIRTLSEFTKEYPHLEAFAGLAHPEQFFVSLSQMGFSVTPHAFPDHHVFTEENFLELEESVIVMTEKDAVKCKDFARPNMWALAVDAALPLSFRNQLLASMHLVALRKNQLFQKKRLLL